MYFFHCVTQNYTTRLWDPVNGTFGVEGEQWRALHCSWQANITCKMGMLREPGTYKDMALPFPEVFRRSSPEHNIACTTTNLSFVLLANPLPRVTLLLLDIYNYLSRNLPCAHIFHFPWKVPPSVQWHPAHPKSQLSSLFPAPGTSPRTTSPLHLCLLPAASKPSVCTTPQPAMIRRGHNTIATILRPWQHRSWRKPLWAMMY